MNSIEFLLLTKQIEALRSAHPEESFSILSTPIRSLSWHRSNRTLRICCYLLQFLLPDDGILVFEMVSNEVVGNPKSAIFLQKDEFLSSLR